MAVFKSTKKLYKDKYEKGYTYFNKINVESERCLAQDYSILNDNFHLVEFYTDNQKGYYDRMLTWAWFKCHLSAKACYDILTTTELANHVEHFAVITHDKDKSESHTHCLIKFFRNEQALKLVDYFHADNCSNAINNKFNRFKYLTHDSDACRKEGKFQYDENEILTDDLHYFKNLQPVELDNTPMTIINAIIEGKSERYMCDTFGDRYIYNKAKYRDCAYQIMNEENLSIAKHYEIIQITEDIITVYDKNTGELVEVCRNLESARIRLENKSYSELKKYVKGSL